MKNTGTLRFTASPPQHAWCPPMPRSCPFIISSPASKTRSCLKGGTGRLCPAMGDLENDRQWRGNSGSLDDVTRAHAHICILSSVWVNNKSCLCSRVESALWSISCSSVNTGVCGWRCVCTISSAACRLFQGFNKRTADAHNYTHSGLCFCLYEDPRWHNPVPDLLSIMIKNV